MEDPETAPVEPPNLRFLRRLVTVLTAVMIIGVLSIVALLVIRLNADRPTLVFPEILPLAPGEELVGWSQTGTHIIAVTDDGRILVFDLNTQEITKEIDYTN